jgi:hypothetical protein
MHHNIFRSSTHQSELLHTKCLQTSISDLGELLMYHKIFRSSTHQSDLLRT